MSSKTPHTCCRRGKRVHVVLKDGTEFIAKFIERTGRFCLFEGGRRIARGEITVFTIVKGAAST
jgi:hypothetical protein